MTRQTSPSDSVMMLDTMIECLVVNYVFSGLVVVFLLLYSTPAPIEVIFTTSLFIVVVIKCEEERKQSASKADPIHLPPPKKKTENTFTCVEWTSQKLVVSLGETPFLLSKKEVFNHFSVSKLVYIGRVFKSGDSLRCARSVWWYCFIVKVGCLPAPSVTGS